MIEVYPEIVLQGSQISVARVKKRYLVGVIGRQWGKTTVGTSRMAYKASQDAGDYMWVAPYYSQAYEAFLRFEKTFSRIIRGVNHSKSEILIAAAEPGSDTGTGTSRIIFRGSDNEDSLRGYTLKGATLDECGVMKKSVWSTNVRPMLMIHRGWADFYGTPKGWNWFRDIYMVARSSNEWEAVNLPSNDGPLVSREEFEEIRATTDSLTFRQEYLAEFIEDGSGVFRNVRACIGGELEAYKPGDQYIAGVDLAKSKDWTVIIIVNVSTMHVAYFERFNQIDWSVQEQRIKNALRRYGCIANIDATGVGDPIYERLSAAGAAVAPVKFTAQTKAHLIQNLALMIENQEITFPEIPELISELTVFNALPGRFTKYEAPAGYHDDCVIALALAVKDLANGGDAPMFGDVD